MDTQFIKTVAIKAHNGGMNSDGENDGEGLEIGIDADPIIEDDPEIDADGDDNNGGLM